jgi:hypothetical protein
MPFSAGRVVASTARGQLTQGIQSAPVSGFPPHQVATFRPNLAADAGSGGINEGDILVRNQGQGMGNPYGIPGSQGPAVNIAGAARAIRGRETPELVTIDRRIDPQWGVHVVQEEIPTRPMGGQRIKRYPQTLPGSRYAQGQTEGVGEVDTTQSAIGPGSLYESPAPIRIPHVWKDGLDMSAGLNQRGFTQQNYSLFIKHIGLGRSGFPTRGIRSLSGVRTDTGPTASRIRIPAVFVPSAVG